MVSHGVLTPTISQNKQPWLHSSWSRDGCVKSFCKMSGSGCYPRKAKHSRRELSPGLGLGDAGLKWCLLEGRTDGMWGIGSFDSKTGLGMIVGGPPTICGWAEFGKAFGKGGEMLSSRTCKYVETLLLNIPKSVSRMFMWRIYCITLTAIFTYDHHGLRARSLCGKYQLHLVTFGENKYTQIVHGLSKQPGLTALLMHA